MAQLSVMEQCLAMLTNIVNQQNQQTTLRSRIEKEIRYLPIFEGRPGTLPAFITSVERALQDYESQSTQVFTVIYNEKIQGAAKNYLEASAPKTWKECKTKLKMQYKPTKDERQIASEIGKLRVSSILELTDKIRIFVSDISKCAIFSEY